MTIETAITELEELKKFGPSFAWWHHTDAVNLGIEALKREQARRDPQLYKIGYLLPGETKEN